MPTRPTGAGALFYLTALTPHSMADLVTIAVTAAMTQFVGPTAKHLGEQALERDKQVESKATAYLAAVGREPQPVEPKILLPLVQAASLESDPTLADKWAALLANAADPAKKVEIPQAMQRYCGNSRQQMLWL
jgi:hypothetical protein